MLAFVFCHGRCGILSNDIDCQIRTLTPFYCVMRSFNFSGDHWHEGLTFTMYNRCGQIHQQVVAYPWKQCSTVLLHLVVHIFSFCCSLFSRHPKASIMTLKGGYLTTYWLKKPSDGKFLYRESFSAMEPWNRQCFELPWPVSEEMTMVQNWKPFKLTPTYGAHN